MTKEQIKIEKHQIKTISIKIKGTTDLLTHGKTPEWLERYEKERNKTKGERTILKPEEEANLGVWKNKLDQPIVPAGNIYRMLRDAFGTLTGFTAGYKKVFDTSVSISPEEILLKFQNRGIDKRAVNIGRKIPDVRYRWRFENWEIEFQVSLRSTLEFNEKRFFTILNFAGQFCGLMDGRTIGFGRFEIVNQ